MTPTTGKGVSWTVDEAVVVLLATQQPEYAGGRPMAQKDLARIGKGMSQSKVSRILKKARDAGVLLQHVELRESALPPDVLQKARDVIAGPSDVEHQLNQRLQEIAVSEGGRSTARLGQKVKLHVLGLPSQPRAASDAQALRMEQFALAAAPLVASLLNESVKTIGVTWGQQLRSLIENGAEEFAAAGRRLQPNARVVPLIGDPLHQADPAGRVSSSVLAERLRRGLGIETTGSGVSLSMLPAFLPGNASPAELRAFKKLIGMMGGYRRIFGNARVHGGHELPSSGDPPLVEELDVILTSLSNTGLGLADGRGPLWDTHGITQSDFREMVLADIGGVLLERPDLPPKSAAVVQRLREASTGITEKEMRHVAHRAFREPGRQCVGVVVIAVGTAKAEAVLAAVERGLVSVIVCDPDLELELARLLKR